MLGLSEELNKKDLHISWALCAHEPKACPASPVTAMTLNDISNWCLQSTKAVFLGYERRINSLSMDSRRRIVEGRPSHKTSINANMHIFFSFTRQTRTIAILEKRRVFHGRCLRPMPKGSY